MAQPVVIVQAAPVPAPAQYQPASVTYAAPPTIYSQQTTVTTIPQPAPAVVVQPVKFDTIPLQVFCPTCNATVITVVKRKIGLTNWAVCGAISLTFVGLLGCCLIPFFITELKDSHHECPNCHSALGTKKIINL